MFNLGKTLVMLEKLVLYQELYLQVWKNFNLLKPDDEEAAIVGEIANGGENLNKEDTHSYRYAKSLAFNLARGFEQLKKIKVGKETAADEAARDIYLYA